MRLTQEKIRDIWGHLKNVHPRSWQALFRRDYETPLEDLFAGHLL